MQGSVSQPTQGGVLLGLGFTLQVRPQGGALVAAVLTGDGGEERSPQSGCGRSSEDPAPRSTGTGGGGLGQASGRH